jgi:Zn finger protein HypA/HybF involved in hydrogenase expression
MNIIQTAAGERILRISQTELNAPEAALAAWRPYTLSCKQCHWQMKSVNYEKYCPNCPTSVFCKACNKTFKVARRLLACPECGLRVVEVRWNKLTLHSNLQELLVGQRIYGTNIHYGKNWRVFPELHRLEIGGEAAPLIIDSLDAVADLVVCHPEAGALQRPLLVRTDSVRLEPVRFPPDILVNAGDQPNPADFVQPHPDEQAFRQWKENPAKNDRFTEQRPFRSRTEGPQPVVPLTDRSGVLTTPTEHLK